MPTQSRRSSTRRRKRPTQVDAPAERVAEVLETDVVTELSDSFVAYAMSTIVSRAIPDVRDGLKPVHRRVLYAMERSRLWPSSSYKKSARVVGDTIGRYHPHGDSAVYETLVRLAQPFALNHPLVDGHGNFGSLDDSAAAARYTECRLDNPGLMLLEDLHEDTVDWVPNYDSSEHEPVVLPAAFPNLLVNGSQGIAVGFSCSIPPHNVAEVTDAVCHLVEHPKATLDDLRAHVSGPDFPTGGAVVDPSALDDIYRTGRGTFRLRAQHRIVQLTARKSGLEFTELPYQVGPERVVDEIRKLVRDKRLDGVTDVRDLSGRTSGMRLTVEVASGANPEAVLAELFTRTSLEVTVACSFVVLDGGAPVISDLEHLCRAFLEHRRDVVRRRTTFRLNKAEARIHLVEGLLRALDAIDIVVDIIRKAPDDATASTRLQKHPELQLSERQAEHVLDLQLRRLTRLSSKKLTDELRTLRATAKTLRAILRSAKKLDGVVVSELRDAAAALERPRRTRLGVSWTPDPTVPMELEAAPCVVAADPTGKRLAVLAPGKRRKPVLGSAWTTTETTAAVLAVTDDGVAHRVDVGQLPTVTNLSAGVPLVEVCDTGSEAQVVGVVSAAGDPLVVVTAGGVIKRVDPDKESATDSWSTIGLADDDRVVAVWRGAAESTAVLVASNGQLLRTSVDQIRPQGRPAGGVAGIKLTDNAFVIAAGPVTDETAVGTICPNGRTKSTLAVEYPVQGRGGRGVRCVRFTGGDTVLAAAAVGANLVADTGEPVPEGRRDGSGSPLDAPPKLIGEPLP